ncbi:MAG TPA: HupE/UreJ family protein [Hyphomicrobiaceae bacterium]|nr:HupE/UreJ family protein [Hyphomicrobiaceae bacterium]
MTGTLKRALAVVPTLVPTAALAHTGIGDTTGFLHGFAHPFGGLDHILAMVTVGILAFQLGGRALWLVPATFVAVMAVGGWLGMLAVPVPYTEIGIALSIVVLGAAVALRLRAPVAVAMALVGLFAVFHGHAHGAELPENAGGLAYGIGFMTATALLHAAGIALGFLAGWLAQAYDKAAVRVGGGLVVVAGLIILVQAV